MANREALPHRRSAETFELERANTRFAVTVGFYPDGRVAEVFVTGAKVGSEFEAVARDGAVLLSLALQHGVPLDVMRHALTRESNNEASTVIGMVVDRLIKNPTTPNGAQLHPV
jgi:hypothetical protein